MPDTQMVRVAREAFKKCRPVDRVVCQDFGMQHDDILDQQLEAALEAALSGHVVVPVADLVELTRICNSGEHDAGYTARKLGGHPLQLNVGVLRETFKLIREKIRGQIDSPPVPEMKG